MFEDYHVHLDKLDWTLSTLDEMCKNASDNGVDRLGIVMHTRAFNGFQPLYRHILSDSSMHKKYKFDKELDEYIEFLKYAKSKGYPVDIGVEVCYSTEGEEFLKNALKDYQFDFVIGSVHRIGRMHYKTAVEKYRDARKVGLIYYGLILRAVQSKLFNIIGHIEVSRREGVPGLNKYPKLLDEICNAMVESNCALEINTKWLTSHDYIVPDTRTIEYMSKKGVKMVFGSDAHHTDRIGYERQRAESALKEAGCDGFSLLI